METTNCPAVFFLVYGSVIQTYFSFVRSRLGPKPCNNCHVHRAVFCFATATRPVSCCLLSIIESPIAASHPLSYRTLSSSLQEPARPEFLAKLSGSCRRKKNYISGVSEWQIIGFFTPPVDRRVASRRVSSNNDSDTVRRFMAEPLQPNG